MPKKYLCYITKNYVKTQGAYRFVLSKDSDICFDPDFVLDGPNLIITSDDDLVHRWLTDEFLCEYFNCSISKEIVRSRILQYYYNRMIDFIALAKKSGKIYIGKSRLEDTLRTKSDLLIVQAYDASEREKFRTANMNIIELFSSQELSDTLGKNAVKYLCLSDNFAQEVALLYQKYKFFNEQR